MRKSRFFLGTRHGNGEYGPQISEEQLSKMIRLLPDSLAPDRHLFPDLSPLIHHVHGQIEEGFRAWESQAAQMFRSHQEHLLESELRKTYENVFEQWNFACSLEDEQNKQQQWNDVIKDARNVLHRLRDAMPEPVPVSGWSETLAERTEQTGRMYTEVLLFSIYARAAYEPASLARDPSLRKYCREIREKVTRQLSGDNALNLLLSAAFHQREHYEKVWLLCGCQNQGEADARLLEHIRAQTVHRVDPAGDFFSQYHSDVEDAYVRTVTTPRYPDNRWDMTDVLWQILHRVGRLEALLGALEKHGRDVDFSRTGETRAAMEAWLTQPDSGDLILPGPGPADDQAGGA